MRRADLVERHPVGWIYRCATCDRRFESRWTFMYTPFCSSECRARWPKVRRQVVQDPVECEECGREFVPKRSDALYCGDACRQRAYQARRVTG